MSMIDTVLIALPWHDDPAVLSRLDACSEVIDYKTGELRGHRGHLKNIFVALNERGLIIQGGLPAFYKESSFHTLTPNETAEAVDALSDALSVYLESGRVYRSDFGFNLNLPSTPREVIRSLGPAPARRKKLEYGSSSVVYKTKSHETAFYDKLMWARDKRILIPEDSPENLLRVERRIKKGVRGRFQEHFHRRMGPVVASQLASRCFQEFGLSEWERATAEIQFERAVAFDFQRTTAKTRDALAAQGIESLGGLETLTGLLEDSISNKHWKGSSKEAKRTKAELRRLANLPEVTLALDIEEQFRQAVKNNVSNWRGIIYNQL